MDKIILLLFLKTHILHLLLINRRGPLLQKGREVGGGGVGGGESIKGKFEKCHEVTKPYQIPTVMSVLTNSLS